MSPIDNQTWNRRYREYMEKINTGSIYGIAEVLRDLHLLKEEKELSFGERKIMDTAKNLLVKELAIARDVKETDILRDDQRRSLDHNLSKSLSFVLIEMSSHIIQSMERR